MYQPKILVIDDSATICSLIRQTLLRSGYADVFTFTNEIAALEALANQEIPIPALVFLDIQLKQLTGYEIARLLRQKPEMQHTIIVMISGLHGRIDKFLGKISGARGYITKPFRPGDITQAMYSLIGPPNQESPQAD